MSVKKESLIVQNKLYGLKKYLLDLIKLYEIYKLPKILMLTGKKGLGKFTLIHHFMSYIFDKENYDLNTLEIKNSNSILNLLSENNNQKIFYYNCIFKNIKIEDIRKLRLDIQKSSFNSLNRFIIFDDVEYLNENCVNALLKTIEEPSETNYFILINNQSKNILDTLKSRSIEIKIFLNSKEKLDITEKLISDLNIVQKIDLNKSTLTPGNYLEYNNIIIEENIHLHVELIVNLKKLLKLYKLKKDIKFLNFAIYLTNQYYFDQYKNNPSKNLYNTKRINIIKKLYETNKLNLNHTNLITEIENYI